MRASATATVARRPTQVVVALLSVTVFSGDRVRDGAPRARVRDPDPADQVAGQHQRRGQRAGLVERRPADDDRLRSPDPPGLGTGTDRPPGLAGGGGHRPGPQPGRDRRPARAAQRAGSRPRHPGPDVRLAGAGRSRRGGAVHRPGGPGPGPARAYAGLAADRPRLLPVRRPGRRGHQRHAPRRRRAHLLLDRHDGGGSDRDARLRDRHRRHRPRDRRPAGAVHGSWVRRVRWRTASRPSAAAVGASPAGRSSRGRRPAPRPCRDRPPSAVLPSGPSVPCPPTPAR